MSSRLYPLYQKGNPQLRIFLPNLFMKLVKFEDATNRPNTVQFIVSNEMSKYDVHSYLKQIYGVEAVSVSTRIAQGRFKKSGRGVIVKEDDFKIAYVTLAKDQTFTFPNLYPEKKLKEEEKEIEDTKRQMKDIHKAIARKLKKSPDTPTWFA